MVHCLFAHGVTAVTAEMTVRFLTEVPVDCDVRVGATLIGERHASFRQLPTCRGAERDLPWPRASFVALSGKVGGSAREEAGRRGALTPCQSCQTGLYRGVPPGQRPAPQGSETGERPFDAMSVTPAWPHDRRRESRFVDGIGVGLRLKRYAAVLHDLGER